MSVILEIAQFYSIVINLISSIVTANTSNTKIHLDIPNKSASFSKASYEYITEQTQVANGILGEKLCMILIISEKRAGTWLLTTKWNPQWKTTTQASYSGTWISKIVIATFDRTSYQEHS